MMQERARTDDHVCPRPLHERPILRWGANKSADPPFLILTPNQGCYMGASLLGDFIRHAEIIGSGRNIACQPPAQVAQSILHASLTPRKVRGVGGSLWYVCTTPYSVWYVRIPLAMSNNTLSWRKGILPPVLPHGFPPHPGC